jgi:hypothetical protein
MAFQTELAAGDAGHVGRPRGLAVGPPELMIAQSPEKDRHHAQRQGHCRRRVDEDSNRPLHRRIVPSRIPRASLRQGGLPGGEPSAAGTPSSSFFLFMFHAPAAPAFFVPFVNFVVHPQLAVLNRPLDGLQNAGLNGFTRSGPSPLACSELQATTRIHSANIATGPIPARFLCMLQPKLKPRVRFPHAGQSTCRLGFHRGSKFTARSQRFRSRPCESGSTPPAAARIFCRRRSFPTGRLR